MKMLLIAIIAIFSTQLFGAGEILCDILLNNGKKKDSASIKLVNQGTVPETFKLAVVKKSGITKKYYAVIGKVRYENVEGKGYFETWNYLKKGTFFSRTLAERGLFRKLQGSSNWRDFIVPFSLAKSKVFPEKINFNLVLPGRGKVEIRKVMLVQGDSFYDLLHIKTLNIGGVTKMIEPWFNASQYGWIIGVLLGVIGGGIGGPLTAICVSKGKYKKLVVSFYICLISISIMLLTLGIVAYFSGQPYGVWYSLSLSGIIGVFVLMPLFFVVLHRYREAEMRKLIAKDM